MLLTRSFIFIKPKNFFFFYFLKYLTYVKYRRAYGKTPPSKQTFLCDVIFVSFCVSRAIHIFLLISFYKHISLYLVFLYFNFINLQLNFHLFFLTFQILCEIIAWKMSLINTKCVFTI